MRDQLLPRRTHQVLGQGQVPDKAPSTSLFIPEKLVRHTLFKALSIEHAMDVDTPQVGGNCAEQTLPDGSIRGLIKVQGRLVAQFSCNLGLAFFQAAHGINQREGEVLLEPQQRVVVRL